MKKATTTGPVTRNRRGEHGALVTVDLEHQGWHGRYHFGTHGKTVEEVTAEHERVITRHERKAEKLTDIQSLIGRAVGGYTITDATVRERGHGFELLCRAKDVNGRRAEWRQYFDDPADVPTAAEIRKGMQERVAELIDQRAEQARHLKQVRQALGLQAE